MDTRVKDWRTEHSAIDTAIGGRDLARSAVRTLVAVAVVWVALFALTRLFPYVENGAAAVTRAKVALAETPGLFPPGARTRVFTFGNSMVMAGFEPLLFDTLAGDRVAAVNLGLPGEDRYVDLLEGALRAGNVPTHILIQSLPIKPEDPSVWTLLLDNKAMIDRLFPFKDYVRDLVVFAYESGGPAGFARQYAANAEQIASVKANEGYYFIKSQSHYPNDQLPADYALPTDQPNAVMHRSDDTGSAEFKRLLELADRYGFTIDLAPSAFRVGAFLPPGPADPALAAAVAPFDRIHVLGPPYLLMPPGSFADPLHLNPAGARDYTARIAALFKAAR